MCLTAKTGRILTAKKNIEVYKDACYITPKKVKSEFRSFEYFIGGRYYETDFIDSCRKGACLYGGGLHAYTKKTMLRWYEGIHKKDIYTGRIVPIRCIIPKGTKYIVGRNNDVFCSELILKEIMYVKEKARGKRKAKAAVA